MTAMTKMIGEFSQGGYCKARSRRPKKERCGWGRYMEREKTKDRHEDRVGKEKVYLSIFN